MARAINKVMLVGNLGKDLTVQFENGQPKVGYLSLALSDDYKGKDGQWVNRTHWVSVVVWNPTQYMIENFTKGTKLYIEGKLQSRQYVDKEGVTRYVTEVVADNFEFRIMGRPAVEEAPAGEVDLY